jgi:hypothetical protein
MKRALLAAFLAGCAAPPPSATELDLLFSPQNSPWRGADAAYSVPLAPGRILWLFGDTFVAPPGVEGRAGSRMIRNSLALQTLPQAPGYFWRSVKGQAADAFAPESGEGWLWPLSGQRLGSKLYLFMMQMIAKGEGAFGFAFLKTVLVTVDNPDQDPAAWTVHQRTIPHIRRSPDGDLFFGGASVLHEGRLYIYGVRESRGKGKGIVVAAVDPASIDDFGSWTFFDGKAWDRAAESARPLFGGGSVEMSVSPIPGGFAAVYTDQGMSPDILLRRAPQPQGPWSAPEILHRCVEPQWSRNYFCYAAKAHPELAASDRELVVTYTCNSMSFPEVVKDLRIYRPRFVRVPLDGTDRR